jgi:polyprenyl P-hydroxybenzoate/phenylacrylic acid decarboxylase-like protein
MTRRRVVIGISGASGPHYGIRLLEVLHDAADIETHLVVSRAARRTIELETGLTVSSVEKLADEAYKPDDLAAPMSSGSFVAEAMVVVPCSMKALSSIANGFADDLLTRAADVTLKEARPLVLLVRETPLSLIHIRNMLAAKEAGATILPPMPAFYQHPSTIDDLINHTVGKTLDALSIPHGLFDRWSGPA